RMGKETITPIAATTTTSTLARTRVCIAVRLLLPLACLVDRAPADGEPFEQKRSSPYRARTVGTTTVDLGGIGAAGWHASWRAAVPARRAADVADLRPAQRAAGAAGRRAAPVHAIVARGAASPTADARGRAALRARPLRAHVVDRAAARSVA